MKFLLPAEAGILDKGSRSGAIHPLMYNLLRMASENSAGLEIGI